MDGKEESLLLLGASLTYAIADNIWTELAYNYDELDSDIPHRSFERNYVSIGGEQKDEHDGYEPNANDPPIIQNMELVGGLICTWGFIHFLQPKKKGGQISTSGLPRKVLVRGNQ